MTIVGLLAPTLGHDLLCATEEQRLGALMAALPDPPGGGFEFRLGASPQTDIQINLQRAEARSRTWISALLSADRADAWKRTRQGVLLIDFLQAWRDDSHATAGVDELWLEFDPSDDPSALPSLFLGFPQYWGARLRARDRLTNWSRHFGIREADIAACLRGLSAIPHGAFLGHAGFMLSRSGGSVRLNVKRLFSDRIPSFLRDVDWQGNGLALADLLQRLRPLPHPRITLCIDVVDGTISDNLAVEVSFSGQPALQAGWTQLFEQLAAMGLAQTEKLDAFARWPGWTTPLTQKTGWPFAAIKESLLEQPDRFVAVERRLSHVKFALRAGLLEAKAYGWFGTGTLSAEATKPSTDPMPYDAWTPADTHRPLSEVSRAFFEQTTDATHDHYGPTFQGWLIDAQGDMTASNRILAVRAGVRDGIRVLDAGCGVCGPAVDIASRWNVRIDAVTNVPRQIELGNAHIRETGLAARVQTTLADFHDLPFEERTFDLALFLESSTSTDDLPRLFAEAYRVLKPGGAIYLKTMFSPPAGQLSDMQRAEMEEANRSQAAFAPTVAETVAELEGAGFGDIRAEDLSARASGERWHEALLATGGRTERSSLGESFRIRAARSHWICADIRAIKP